MLLKLCLLFHLIGDLSVELEIESWEELNKFHKVRNTHTRVTHVGCTRTYSRAFVQFNFIDQIASLPCSCQLILLVKAFDWVSVQIIHFVISNGNVVFPATLCVLPNIFGFRCLFICLCVVAEQTSINVLKCSVISY